MSSDQRTDSTQSTSGSGPAASVSTHILDTSVGRPAAGVPVQLSVRGSGDELWAGHVRAQTDADGRCAGLPALPEGTTQVRLLFEVEQYFTGRTTGTSRTEGSFFPEVTVTFTVAAGEHYHVPLLLNPYGYSVYRGS